jgi:hypothetical protein
MTTSISRPGNNELVAIDGEATSVESAAKAEHPVRPALRHTLPSRFAFLIVGLAIILSTLAYGTVHYWSLAVFFLGAVTLVALWVLDSWSLGLARISRNVLQLPLAGLILLGLIQVLPLRTPDNVAIRSIPLVRSLSFDPYSTRLLVDQMVALLIYF